MCLSLQTKLGKDIAIYLHHNLRICLERVCTFINGKVFLETTFKNPNNKHFQYFSEGSLNPHTLPQEGAHFLINSVDKGNS